MATINEIKQQAEAVKNATQVGENTAVRVGGALAGLAEIAKAQEDNIGKKADKEETNRLLAKKANTADVNTKFTEEKKRVDVELSKKFDKESVVQEFGDSEDKVVSQFALPFRVIESPEFFRAIVDEEDHFLFGIQLDGSIEWGKGIPAPIRAKLQEIINQCQQDKTDILEAINAAKTELSASIAALQEGKVDKEKGKSLIEDEVKECFKVIENAEFIKAITDAEDKVLFGIYRDSGKPYFPLNEMYHVEQNEEFFAVWLDAANHVLFGIRKDGEIIGEIHAVNALKQVISQLQSDLASLQEKLGQIDSNLKELLNVFSLQENPEYLAVEQDAEGKILSSTNPDGSHYIHNAKSETIPTEFSHIEDPEGRTEITTDAAGKVLGYRDMEGTRHEKKMSVEDLKISKKAAISIMGDFATAGIKLNPSDWSGEKYIHIPIPECAYINLLTSRMPTAKSALGISGVTCNIPCDVEFNDMQGNYFRKPILLSAQGDSTLAFNKKNLALDFFATTEDRDNDGETFSMKFGDWVAQDSFHLKAYYQDAHRGVSAVSYMICEEMAKSRNTDNDRPYKYLFATKYEDLSLGTTPVTKLSENFGKGAKCFPQGFPVIVYQNGVFYGVYSWQLKKHRDNYFMDKKDAKNVHLDGILSKEFWKGNINWSEFEVRNPKSIYYQEQQTINGKKTLKYNGDFCYEIMGKDSAYYDAENKDMKKCAEVKNTIIRLSQALGVLQEAVNAGKSEVEVRKVIEEYFMPSFLIDYILEINVTGNTDATNKNWQWTTWDTLLWTANAYDHDMLFGAQMLGNFFGNSGSSTSLIGDGLETPLGWIVKYYKEELKERYTELRKLGIFNTQHICDLIKSWEARIGYENYDKEYEKWNESPCNRPSCIDYEHWALSSGMVSTWVATTTYNSGEYVRVDTKTYKSLTNSNVGNMPGESSEHWEDATFNEAKTYSENDICGYGKYQTYLFRCVKSGINIPPLTKFYNSYPYELGTFDSVYRVYYWLKKRIENLDKYFEFKF